MLNWVLHIHTCVLCCWITCTLCTFQDETNTWSLFWLRIALPTFANVVWLQIGLLLVIHTCSTRTSYMPVCRQALIQFYINLLSGTKFILHTTRPCKTWWLTSHLVLDIGVVNLKFCAIKTHGNFVNYWNLWTHPWTDGIIPDLYWHCDRTY